jgi:imidazolonepropionase-like amidohydrolase
MPVSIPIDKWRGLTVSPASHRSCSQEVQAEMFPIYVTWGATPVYTLRVATTVNAEIIHMQDCLGTIERGSTPTSSRFPVIRCITSAKCSA